MGSKEFIWFSTAAAATATLRCGTAAAAADGDPASVIF
jgi:hypothetical protein